MRLVLMGGVYDAKEFKHTYAPPMWDIPVPRKFPPLWEPQSFGTILEISKPVEIIRYYRSHVDMDNPDIVYYSNDKRGVPFLGRRKMG